MFLLLLLFSTKRKVNISGNVVVKCRWEAATSALLNDKFTGCEDSRRNSADLGDVYSEPQDWIAFPLFMQFLSPLTKS